MTRLEAYDIEFKIKQSLHEAKMELINKIYDDFESRTCESCKYAIKEGFLDKVCDNESGIAYDVVVKTTDGCSKWETR